VRRVRARGGAASVVRVCQASVRPSVRARTHSLLVLAAPHGVPRCARRVVRVSACALRLRQIGATLRRVVQRHCVLMMPAHCWRVRLPAALCSMVQRGWRVAAAPQRAACISNRRCCRYRRFPPLLLACGATLRVVVWTGMRVRCEVLPRRRARFCLVCEGGCPGPAAVDEREGSSAAHGRWWERCWGVDSYAVLVARVSVGPVAGAWACPASAPGLGTHSGCSVCARAPRGACSGQRCRCQG
jgi:hypothetical protein